MAIDNLPKSLAKHVVSNQEALRTLVRSHARLASGFATSEPHTFYATIWDHIQREDLHDIDIRQALFMAPHKLCLGNALSSTGLWGDFAKWVDGKSPFAGLVKQTNQVTKKLQGLARLIEHYEEMRRRNITLTSPFIGQATNTVIPNNTITRTLYPDYIGRNTTRMGITRMQSIHFPDAVDSMGFDPDGNPMVDTFVFAMTPPDEHGDMSHGLANGANGEILEKAIRYKTINVLIYVNKAYPFTRGYGDDAPNTVNVKQLEGLAKAGRLFLVEDDGKLPSLPKGALDSPAPAEVAIAQNVANHVEAHLAYTKGRALQVGFGPTGVLAIKALKASSWTGRCFTEMLEPFTLDLFDSGKISGTHFIERDGTRTQLDGKFACTFTICEEGSDFYKRLDNNPAVIVSAASRVVIPEAFHFGLGINSCLSIDFHGHVNAGGRDKNHFSGIGGGATIIRGLSKGGIGYLCMKSTHTTPEGRLRSSIFPFLPFGTPVAYVGPDLMGGRDGARFFLVTEHGVAQLSGKDQHAFIRNLISVADPRFRDQLRQEAYKEFRVRF